MTLEDLLTMEYPNQGMLVNDETVIKATKEFRSYGAALRRKGNWYEDHILDLMNEKVAAFEMDLETNTLAVYLK